MPRRTRRTVHRSSSSGAESVAGRPLQRFVIAGLVALLVISIAMVLVAWNTARDIALRQAKSQGFRLAKAMDRSLNVRALRHPDSTSAADLTRQIAPRLDDKSLV